ncbi:MAG: SRPBCC family protein [Nocardioides sp.]|nr:SRPBCC family protein [Nocardioides sp.]
MPRGVHVDVPVQVAFDYFVDPHQRPRWQSSLARVEDVDGEPRVGQTWVDVTKPGLKPRMRTTELDRPHRWTEVGTWHGVSATLTLVFAPAGPQACLVEATMRLRGRGLLALPVAALNRLAPLAVRADLTKAAKILAGHPSAG